VSKAVWQWRQQRNKRFETKQREQDAAAAGGRSFDFDSF
jgi:hypothetical protein